MSSAFSLDRVQELHFIFPAQVWHINSNWSTCSAWSVSHITLQKDAWIISLSGWNSIKKTARGDDCFFVCGSIFMRLILMFKQLSSNWRWKGFPCEVFLKDWRARIKMAKEMKGSVAGHLTHWHTKTFLFSGLKVVYQLSSDVLRQRYEKNDTVKSSFSSVHLWNISNCPFIERHTETHKVLSKFTIVQLNWTRHFPAALECWLCCQGDSPCFCFFFKHHNSITNKEGI